MYVINRSISSIHQIYRFYCYLAQLKLVHEHSKPQLKATLNVDKDHKAYGLKVLLTQTIANISHDSKEIQDTVREQGGLVPILSGCHYDERNPCMYHPSYYKKYKIK